MWYERVFSSLDHVFDGNRAFRHVGTIYGFDRWNSFDKYVQSAEYCAECMKKMGLQEVELLPVKADGRTAYGDWVMPRASDVTAATLKIVEPITEDAVVADYLTEPFHLMMNSAPTPKGGIRAEVVTVDDPAETSPDAVGGKLILTGRYFSEVLPLALKGNAAGIISDNSIPAAEAISRGYYDPETMQNTIFWVNYFLTPLNDTNLFGFQLSYKEGRRLRRVISEVAGKGGRVLLHATVDSRFYDGFTYTVSGMIPGSDPQGDEVDIYGHLHEGGANDNASGCGVALELASSILEGIRRGTLPRPSRNIRFILGFEAVGEMAYLLRNKARLAKTVGWINIDMVGSNAADKAILDVYHNPWATWSYCDTLAPALIREYQCFTRDKFGFGEKGYEILDNLAADPMFGVPTISMIMCPAESYHSSIDTMERVDPKVLKRSGLITGALAYFLSSADAGAIRWLLEEIRVHAYTTLTQVARQRWYAAYPLACAFRRGCLSLRRLADGGDEELLEEIALTAESLPSPSRVDLAGLVSAEWKSRAEKRIPVRLVEGCLTSQTLPKNATDAARWRLYFRYRWNCPLFLADGARNIYEIACLAAAELGIDNVSGYLQELIEFFDFLKKYNYVRLDMADGE